MKRTIMAVICGLQLATAGICYGAHPLVTDDAGTLGTGTVQVEVSGDLGKDRDRTGGSTTTTRVRQLVTTIGVGVMDKVDLSVGFNRHWQTGDTDGTPFTDAGSADFTLALKWQIFEHQGYGLAVTPQVSYLDAMGSSYGHSVSTGATLILSKAFEPFALHANLGYAYNSHSHNQETAEPDRRNSIVSLSLAGTYEVFSGLKLVTDFGTATNEDAGSEEMPVFGLAGLVYALNRQVDLSAGVKVGLTKPENDLTGTLGVTITF